MLLPVKFYNTSEFPGIVDAVISQRVILGTDAHVKFGLKHQRKSQHCVKIIMKDPSFLNFMQMRFFEVHTYS